MGGTYEYDCVRFFVYIQFGALYLDKDVRSFSAYVTTLASSEDQEIVSGAATSLTWVHALREKLSSLQQILMLLNISTPDEVFDYWGPNAITQIAWRFDAQQVRDIVRLRVEFSTKDIENLRLE
jgi:hypothetical protein